MVRQNRDELLGLALLAAMIAVFVCQLAARFSAPLSSPMDFVFSPVEHRDGPASLRTERPSGNVVLRLAFAGDIMQHSRQATDDFNLCYRGLRPLLAESDVAEANLEFPVDVTLAVGPPDGSVQFNGSKTNVAALAKVGFNVLSTANNHCFDQGVEGLARTQQVLEALGLRAVGNLAGSVQDRPVIVERNGLRIGFFAYTFPPNSYAGADGKIRYWRADWPVHELNFSDWSAEYRAQGLELIARHVRAARDAHVDWLVAVVHWGREWEFQPTADQRLAGRDFIDQGYDLVIGSHGHVLNPVEVYRNRLIAYSLGNLISDFRPWEARTGAILQVNLALSSEGRLEIADFDAVPILTDDPGHRVRPVRAEGAADQVARDLAKRILGPACAFALPRPSANSGPRREPGRRTAR
jgi:poly-gamma-glutamate capsule biosynthesis protein CapA/YwtB (metallophosphatase superfamily)